MIADATETTRAPRPLMSIAAVCWRLDCGPDKVLRLIEDGDLLFAWNIASSNTRQRIPRVLTECVEDFISKRSRPFKSEDAEWNYCAGLIFPVEPILSARDLTRTLNCGRQHALDLIREKHFTPVRGYRCRRGPGGSPRIHTASVAAWLKSRRLI